MLQFLDAQTSLDRLKQIGEDFKDWKLETFPEAATYNGVHQYDDRLDQYTLTAFTAQKVEICFIKMSNCRPQLSVSLLALLHIPFNIVIHESPLQRSWNRPSKNRLLNLPFPISEQGSGISECFR